MKIRIVASQTKTEELTKKLLDVGFIITDDAEFTLREDNFVPKSFVGNKNGSIKVVEIIDIILIESYGREVNMITLSDVYNIKEKLYEIEENYQSLGLIRINKSQIVNKKYIDKINPLLNSRIKLTLTNKQVLIVSRTYIEKFKEVIGF